MHVYRIYGRRTNVIQDEQKIYTYICVSTCVHNKKVALHRRLVKIYELIVRRP